MASQWNLYIHFVHLVIEGTLSNISKELQKLIRERREITLDFVRDVIDRNDKNENNGKTHKDLIKFLKKYWKKVLYHFELTEGHIIAARTWAPFDIADCSICRASLLESCESFASF